MNNYSLQSIGNFSEADILLVEKELQKRTLKKEEPLLKTGEICQSVFFIEQGFCYQHNFSAGDEQIIIDLHLSGEWCLNQQSFITQKPSATSITAFTDVQVAELNAHSIHHLIKLSPVFFQLGKLLDAASARINFFDKNFSPTEKYLHILEHRPALLHHFPLKMIASYLKITPETLSRVREKLSKEKLLS